MVDIRWKQRFANFTKAMKLYDEAVLLNPSDRLSQEGLIQRFEYCFELAWKTLQDILIERGYNEIRGPRPVIEKSFQDGILRNGELWLKMLKSRNETGHLYNESVFLEILGEVKKSYLQALKELHQNLSKL